MWKIIPVYFFFFLSLRVHTRCVYSIQTYYVNLTYWQRTTSCVFNFFFFPSMNRLGKEWKRKHNCCFVEYLTRVSVLIKIHLGRNGIEHWTTRAFIPKRTSIHVFTILWKIKKREQYGFFFVERWNRKSKKKIDRHYWYMTSNEN